MQYRRCKCGACERWDTGEAVRECEGCEKCGTTFSSYASGHQELQPHDFEIRYDERTGLPSKKTCSRCHHTVRLTENEIQNGL